MTISLSVILIVKNEAARIRHCLESIAWADEIIVLDSGSTDATVEVCREFTEKVYVTDWPGFGPQKNRALEYATGEWVFSIDADEWVTPELQREIQSVLTSAVDAYFVPRRTQYLGEWIKYGDVGRDKVIRLFRRGAAKFSMDCVHESLQVPSEKIGYLQNFLMHASYRTVEELLERMNYYTTLSAKMRADAGKKSSLTKAIVHAAWAFFKAYFLRLGFLDGRIGFVVAASSAESSYYRYLKLLYRAGKT